MKPESKKKHIFGPVPSRRLGRSLGVDLVPYKTCSYDCVYCQIGRTTDITLKRAEWVSADAILEELALRLDSKPDYVTLSGSGEPTLYSRLGELIRRIKRITDIPVAVLTNGSLLWRVDVRRDLREADLVVPSLDAGRAETFARVNRPPPGLSYDFMLAGLVAFRDVFQGQYWLEVLLVQGVNDSDEEIRAIADAAKRIRPDRVQLNTVTRPPAEGSMRPVTKQRIEELAGFFDPPAEIIADFKEKPGADARTAGDDAIIEMLLRRPCTLDDIAGGLGLHRNEIVKRLGKLEEAGEVEQAPSAGNMYYKVSGQ